MALAAQACDPGCPRRDDHLRRPTAFTRSGACLARARVATYRGSGSCVWQSCSMQRMVTQVGGGASPRCWWCGSAPRRAQQRSMATRITHRTRPPASDGRSAPDGVTERARRPECPDCPDRPDSSGSCRQCSDVGSIRDPRVENHSCTVTENSHFVYHPRIRFPSVFWGSATRMCT